MFVFPAFNDNYKTRKRTFKCCNNCRVKRVKCQIIKDYEVSGCEYCRKSGLQCSLRSKHAPGENGAERVPRLPPLATQPAQTLFYQTSPQEYEVDMRSRRDLQTNGSPAQPGQNGNIAQPIQSSLQTVQTAVQPVSNVQSGVQTPIQPVQSHAQSNTIANPVQNIASAMAGTPTIPQATYTLADQPPSMALMAPVYQQPTPPNMLSPYPSAQPLITATFLKQKHNFNSVGRAADDIALWLLNEIDYDMGPESGLRNPLKVYPMLCLIDAFTLSLAEFLIQPEDERQLVELFMLKVNILWPLLPADEFWREYAAGTVPLVLIYAMVLAISRDVLAEPILIRVFGEADYQSKLREFISALDFKTRQIMLVMPQLCPDFRYLKLVVHLILLFHYTFDRFGNEQMAADLTDAINIAVGMEIHKKDTIVRVAESKRDYVMNVWWCLYVADRIDGIVNARSLFIRLDDFNLELPYRDINLLKLVQLARSVENMMLAVFRPFDNNNIVLPLNKMEIRYKMFDLDEFQKMEFDICDKERINGFRPYDWGIQSIAQLRTRINDYIAMMQHFLYRILNNTVIMIGQKIRLDNPHVPNSIPQLYVLQAINNVMFYHKQLSPAVCFQFPAVPYTLALCSTNLLIRRVRSKFLPADKCAEMGLDYEGNDPFKFEWDEQIGFLEANYAPKWWFIDHYCQLVRQFNERYLADDSAPPRSQVQLLKIDFNSFCFDILFKMLYSDFYG